MKYISVAFLILQCARIFLPMFLTENILNYIASAEKLPSSDTMSIQQTSVFVFTFQSLLFGEINRSCYQIHQENCNKHFKIQDWNFLARYYNGNGTKQKGILNMHLNIRSLKTKVPEVKNIIKEHSPHILGLSECELVRASIDEKSLKIPGYEILYPKSWFVTGHARVAVYVKKGFKYQQVLEL